mgnify:CR=1 FL=1
MPVGPAQRMHGATYAVEAEFRAAALDHLQLLIDIGLAKTVLRELLDSVDYSNLDENPLFKGTNTTTEFMAGEIFRRMKARVVAGAVGPGTAGAIESMRVVLRESPVAWASFEGSLR